MKDEVYKKTIRRIWEMGSKVSYEMVVEMCEASTTPEDLLRQGFLYNLEEYTGKKFYILTEKAVRFAELISWVKDGNIQVQC